MLDFYNPYNTFIYNTNRIRIINKWFTNKKLSEKEKAPDSYNGENGVEVVGVCFRSRKKIYKFSPNGKVLEVGTNITVDTINGAMVGMIVHSNYFVDPSGLEFELKNVLEIIK